MRKYQESRRQRLYRELTKNAGFNIFLKILDISLEISSISNLRCENRSNSKFLIRNTQYFDRNLRFLIEIQGILIEIVGFHLKYQEFRKDVTIVFQTFPYHKIFSKNDNSGSFQTFQFLIGISVARLTWQSCTLIFYIAIKLLSTFDL